MTSYQQQSFLNDTLSEEKQYRNIGNKNFLKIRTSTTVQVPHLGSCPTAQQVSYFRGQVHMTHGTKVFGSPPFNMGFRVDAIRNYTRKTQVQAF